MLEFYILSIRISLFNYDLKNYFNVIETVINKITNEVIVKIVPIKDDYYIFYGNTL